jgi:hypothetical protein
MCEIALSFETLRRATLIAAIVLALVFEVCSANAQVLTPEEQQANRTYHQMDTAYRQQAGRAPPPATPSASPAATPAPVAQGTRRPSCTKNFRIAGTDQIFAVVKHFDEFTKEELYGSVRDGKNVKGWWQAWNENYAASGYQEIRTSANQTTATKKQDCAGYVMDQLWQTGPFFVTAEKFIKEVVARHGKFIGDPTNWGDVSENDIVVWSSGRHVAIVKKASPSEIIVYSKNDTEPVYRFDLKKVGVSMISADPLVTHYGTPNIYRVDPQKVRIIPVSSKDCDEASAEQVDRVVDALKSLPQCAGNLFGPTCFRSFIPHKDGFTVTATIGRAPPAGAETTQVRLIVWEDQAAASRDFKSSLDARKKRTMSPRSAFESLAEPNKPETGGFEFWPNTDAEGKQYGHALGVFICGNVVGELKMSIASGVRGATGQTLIDATKVQMNGLLQQIGNVLQAKGGCA